MTDDVAEPLHVLSNVHKFPMCLAKDAECHGSEATPQRGSGWGRSRLTSSAPGSLRGFTVCRDACGTSRVLLGPRGGLFAVRCPLPSVLEELVLQI